MFVAKYNIKYICKVPKSGYHWDGEDLIPTNKDIVFIEKNYNALAYDDFRDVVKSSHESKNTYKNRIRVFANKWGNPFRDGRAELIEEIKLTKSPIGFKPFLFGIKDFNKMIKFFVNIKDNIENNKIPNVNRILPSSYRFIDYEFDEESKQIVPTYRPNNLWEAIQFTIVFSGYDAQQVGDICAREGCENRVIGKRKGAKFCSNKCRGANRDQNKALEKKRIKLSQTNT